MRFEINFTNDSFEKAWTELEMLEPQLMGNMKLSNFADASGNLQFVTIELEEIDDTVTFMKALRDLAEKGIEWVMMATSDKNR